MKGERPAVETAREVRLFESIEAADTTEPMGYLTGVTSFAKRGQERAARFPAAPAASRPGTGPSPASR